MKITITILILLFPFVSFSQNPKKDSVEHRTDSIQKLKEVMINGSIERMLKEAPGNLTVVDVKPFYSTNITPVQILRGTSGIKVKQDGGYGSRVDFFINGSTGKQLKFFLDGLPLDNLGETLGINNLPVEQIERIEIYKGVIPVELGADVLGGAINIVTRKEKSSYLDASYAISSFDTHRLNISGRKLWSDHFYTSIQAYGGYSKNDYTIDAANINQSGQFDTIKVKRFHDRYENYIVKAEAGLLNQSWADQFTFSLSGSALDKQLQNNLTMNQPYAKAVYRENLFSGILKYQKANLFKHFNLTGYLSYNRVNGLFIDTSRNIITWDQRIADRRISGAELGPTTFRHTYTNTFNQKLVAAYWLGDHSKLVFSNTLQNYRRTAKDTLAQRINNGIDLYGAPSSQLKNISGLGFDGGFFSNKLKVSAAVKNFYLRMNGFYVNQNIQFTASQEKDYWGYNTAFAYSLTSALTLKTSYEHAVRLPDVEEAFGDLILIKPNPELKAEESNNFNINSLYHNDRFDIELTGFFRDVNHLIFFVPNSQGSAKAFNLLKAKVSGVEASIIYRINKAFTFNANATYQNLRNKSYIENEGIPNERYINQRIPNIPYLLANASISYRKNEIAGKGTQLQVFYNSNFTNQYFLYWANDGDVNQKNRIPTQFLQNAGVSFAIKQISFTLESYNLANAKTYDNFKLQLPGRSISFKTRLYLK